MDRKRHGSWLLAVAASTALLASARPAAATFTVAVSGTTTMVAQTDTDTLVLTRAPSGELVASDSASLLIFPPTDNLFVRGTDSTTPSSVIVVLDSALPGSLMLDLPGANDVTVRGDVGSIGNALKVKGGDAAQTLRLGTTSVPISIGRTATFDMGHGFDQLLFQAGGSIGGSLTTKGVNTLDASAPAVDAALHVARSLKFDAKQEGFDNTLDATFGLVVGRSFTFVGGGGRDLVILQDGGSIGRSVKLDFGEGPGDVGLLVDSIGGSVTAQFSADPTLSHFFALGTDQSVVKGAVKVTMPGGDGNSLYLDGEIDGKAIAITTGPGRDSLRLNTTAPRAKATIALGAGDDDVRISRPDLLQLARLSLDFGDGDEDEFDDNGWVPPPGSTITGLP